MAKLILSLEGAVLKEVSLNKERTTIGRKADNDIPIDNLAVSGHHAVIVTILNDSFLEDLGSTNGTLVNGNPVQKHFLQNNDVIEIGKYKLKYVAEPVAKAAGDAADFEKTMVLRPGAMPKPAPVAPVAPGAVPAAKAAPDGQTTMPLAAAAAAKAPSPATTPAMPPRAVPQAPQAPAAAANAPSPTAVPAKPPHAVPPAPQASAAAAPGAAPAAKPGAQVQPVATIQILTGPSAGKELELTKTLTTLGKPGVQVAVITRRPNGYFITHVEGGSFPVINGNTLDPHPHQLNDHDVIELAGVKMEFFIKS